jgi:hypothetical protein
MAKGWLKNYSSVSPLMEKETRCPGILSAKCPIFTGLLRTAYAKLFLSRPFDIVEPEFLIVLCRLK